MTWIQTKAGLQMAETIIRYLPRMLVCLEEIAKVYTFKGLDEKNGEKAKYKKEIQSELRTQFNKTYGGDIVKLIDEMDIRKQENTNLKFQMDRLETIIEERK